MSNGKYHDAILAHITKHGATGVNALGNALNVPATTLQKYLTNQNYFKKTDDRKWDLPNKVNSGVSVDTVTLMVESVEKSLMVIKAQMQEVTQNMDNALVPINTLKRGVSNLSTSVSDNAANIDENTAMFIKISTELQGVFDKYKDKFPEDYRDILINFDIGKYLLNEGYLHLVKGIGGEITEVFSGHTDIFSDEALKMFNKYQKEA
jgi:hypothetical protein